MRRHHCEVFIGKARGASGEVIHPLDQDNVAWMSARDACDQVRTKQKTASCMLSGCVREREVFRGLLCGPLDPHNTPCTKHKFRCGLEPLQVKQAIKK